MACKDRLKQYLFSVIKFSVPNYIGQFFETIVFITKHFCRFGSDNNIILRVAPLRDKKHDSYRNYFPPPLYGVPPDRLLRSGEKSAESYAKYGLFLWPDRLYNDVFKYSLLLLMTLIPFITLFYCCPNKMNKVSICSAIFILLGLTISAKIIFIIVSRRSPPILNKVWALWPESQYTRFLTVPHLSEITKEDDTKPHQRYWRPDTSSPLSHQPAYYAKGKNTLQEVMLHLSVFNFLFYEKNQIVKDSRASKALKKQGWLYLLSPVVISYILLFLAFFASSLFYPANLQDEIKQIPVLLRLPYFYVCLALIWSVLTFNIIMRHLQFLERLQKRVQEGFYDVHLDLIPQQILNVISDIPDDKLISKGMEEIGNILRLVQAAALVTFLMVLEIFASGFS